MLVRTQNPIEPASGFEKAQVLWSIYGTGFHPDFEFEYEYGYGGISAMTDDDFRGEATP
jgi:hypothetical protein